MKIRRGESSIEENPTAGSLTRRRLIEAALLGGGTLAVGSQLGGRAFAQSVGVDGNSAMAAWQLADTYEGEILGASGDEVAVRTGSTERLVSISGGTTLWRETNVSRAAAMGVSKRVLVRSYVPGAAEGMWFDLVAIRGVVTKTTARGWQIDVHVPYNEMGPLTLTYNDATLWSSFTSPSSRPGPAPQLAVGDGVYVTGTLTNESLVGATIDYARPVEVETTRRHAPAVGTLLESPDATYCCYYYNGMATKFTCGTGAGACGSCNTGNNSQAAWPIVNGHCDYECTGQPALSCGDQFFFYPCAQRSAGAGLTVADVGPCQQSHSGCTCSVSVCSHTCGTPNHCGYSASLPIVDLTLPTFARFSNPVYGCIPCQVCFIRDC